MTLAFAAHKEIGAHLVTGGTDVYTCPAGKIAKVFNLQVANVDGTADADASVSKYIAETEGTFFFAKTVAVPADAALRPLGDKGETWLSPGDKINALASADGDLDITGDVFEFTPPAA